MLKTKINGQISDVLPKLAHQETQKHRKTHKKPIKTKKMTSQKVSTTTISMKQKRKITNPKADICLKTDGENCLIKYSGHTVELVDLVFTAMKQDDTMAAIICQTARDFVQSLKIDVRAWKALTANCAEVSRQLVSRPAVKRPNQE